MSIKIKIIVADMEFNAEFADTPSAKKIIDILPVKGKVSRWGDEIYFPIPLELPLDETSRDEVEVGDIGYWPTGRAICIFFGPTPLSEGDKIKPASAVNILGKVLDNTRPLKKVTDGTLIKIILPKEN